MVHVVLPRMLFHCNVGRSGSNRPFVENCYWAGPDGRYWDGHLRIKVSGGGTQWPAILEPACSDIPPLLREDLCHQWIKHGFTGMKLKPVQILEVRAKRLRDVPAPQYWSLGIMGKVVWQHLAYALHGETWEMIDGQLLGEDQRKNYTPGLWNRFLRHRNARVEFRRIPVPGAWDGSDFFNPPNPPFAYAFCCTSCVVEAVRSAGLESFAFAPLDTVGFPQMPLLKAMPWPPGPVNYGARIEGGPPLCAGYESAGCPVRSEIEPAGALDPVSLEKPDPESGVCFFGQPVTFQCDGYEGTPEFVEFMSRIRAGLPAVMKGAEAYFLKHVSNGQLPEIWTASIQSEEEECSLERWVLHVEGDAGGHNAVQSWALTIEHGRVVDMCGMD